MKVIQANGGEYIKYFEYLYRCNEIRQNDSSTISNNESPDENKNIYYISYKMWNNLI